MKISIKNRKIGYTHMSQSGFFSFRGIKKIAFESRLEKDFLTSFAFHESVLNIEEQPITIAYQSHQGKTLSYTPDFMVEFKDSILKPVKTMIVEVKPRDILKKDLHLYRERFKAMVSHCQTNDMIFKIYDESRIHTHYFNNVTLLMRYRRYRYDPIEGDTILNYIHSAGQAPIGLIPEIFGGTETDKAQILGHVYHLLSTKKLLADLTVPISKETEIWVNEEYGNEEALL